MSYLRFHKLACNDPESIGKSSLRIKEEAA